MRATGEIWLPEPVFEFDRLKSAKVSQAEPGAPERSEDVDYPSLPGPDSPILQLDGTPITATANFPDDADAFVFTVSGPTQINFDVDGTTTGIITIYQWVEGSAYRIATHAASYPSAGTTFLTEAGTYFLHYSSAVGGHEYAAWVAAVYDDQPNTPQVADTALIAGTTQAGIIDLPRDVDVFYIDVEAGDAFRFASSLTGLDTGFSLSAYNADFSAQTMLVRTTDGVIEHVFETAGRYYLFVETNGDLTGTAYTLETIPIVDYEAGDPSTSITVTAGGSYSGAIDYPGDVDWIAFDLQHDQLISVNLSDINFAGQVAIYDANGVEIVTPSYGIPYFNAPATGRFYISVTSPTHDFPYPLQSGTYTLSVDSIPDDYGASPTTSATIPTDGTPITGTVNFADDLDWLRLTSDTTQVFRVVMQATARQNFNPLMIAYDESGNDISRLFQYNAQLGSTTVVRIITVEAGQTIYLQPVGVAVNASYTFTATPVIDDQTGAVALPRDGTPVYGAIDYEFDHDLFSLTVEEDERIELRALAGGNPGSGSNFTLMLEGPDLEPRILQLVTDGSSWVGVIEDIPAGEYTISVMYNNGYLTDFELTAHAIRDDHPNELSVGITLDGFGGMLSGAFEYFDDRDVIGVDLPAAGSYRATFHSIGGSFAAPAFSLLNSSGDVIAMISETGPGQASAPLTFDSAGQFYFDLLSAIPAQWGFGSVGSWALELTYLLGAGDDRFSASVSSESIDGEAGHDRILGLDGADHLFGGAGNDALAGGQGNDHLSGGSGNNKLVGGTGRDIFVVGNSDGIDTISDFQPTWDALHVLASSGDVTYADLDIQRDGADVLITFSNGGRVRLVNTDMEQVQPSMFVFLGAPAAEPASAPDFAEADPYFPAEHFDFTPLTDADWHMA